MSFTEYLATDLISLRHETHNENFRKAQFANVASKTADFTVWTDDATGSPKHVYLCDATSGAITVTLPAVADADPTAGRVVTVKKTDASGNAVTLDADGSETIDGATTKALSSQYDSVTIVSDGTSWHII